MQLRTLTAICILAAAISSPAYAGSFSAGISITEDVFAGQNRHARLSRCGARDEEERR